MQYISNIKKHISQFFFTIGDFTIFSFKAFKALFTPPFRVKLIIDQLMHTGIASISVIAISSIAIGMIFTLQLAIELEKFNSAVLVGNIIGQVFSKELSPVFTALMLIGKNGSAMTAELGTMHISDQIYAMKTMSVDPIQYLVPPRLIACMWMFPLLSALSTLVGLGGASFVAFYLLNIDKASTIDYMFKSITPFDIIMGVFKCFLMSIFICLICCYLGMSDKRNSNDVAKQTTNAVVISSLTILILDFILGKLILLINI